MNIRFLGAVKGVTGSSHLIKFKDKLIMLDCGMFQGKDEDLNYEELDVNPADIDYLFLSHSHIDHSGRIPLLVKKGFKGTIYCSKPTYDLCEIMLIDSAHIQETEAEWKNRKAKRSGKPLVEPMYTQDDAQSSFKFFNPVLYEQIIKIDDYITVKFNDAGHILGSSIIEMWFKEDNENIKMVYSGDIGMNEKPILKDPTSIESADYIIMESTYGNRLHESIEKRTEELINMILKTIRRGGTVVIPSFAVGRTQEIIYELNKYYDSKLSSKSSEINELKKIPVYIDSPLATKATEVFKRNAHVFDKEATKYLMSGDNPLEFENLHFTQSAEESKQLNFSDEPKIIISASGMCDAGRIKHHLKHNLWKKESSVIFVGYQAEGTLGRRIVDGVKDVKLFGEQIHINAEIFNIEGFSGHADKNGLLNWLKNFKEKPKKVFIVHGEPESKTEFAEEVEKTLGFDCIIPKYNISYEIKTKTKIEEIPVKNEEPSERPIIELDESHIKELKKDIQNLKKLFENALNLTEGYLTEDEIKIDKYKKINNNILDLENEIMNLTILSGK
ncbi:MBL fold metallo-hydrolase [Sedimentibacter sp. MB31-C6]|uniref:MBL fold metallo-hydrolase n=1 Tax=Sedimentibacter sp. MB31-C6 TaxID=3109366 RepID=UPI002DDCEEB1|nr:MBL fold metallo-hydrolase [Sedimentibacter sp. MB36-C1]WSI03986.1 MBL fold metallo-hydrolase [Sedimentibacter sp. MB36-C1]